MVNSYIAFFNPSRDSLSAPIYSLVRLDALRELHAQERLRRVEARAASLRDSGAHEADVKAHDVYGCLHMGFMFFIISRLSHFDVASVLYWFIAGFRMNSWRERPWEGRREGGGDEPERGTGRDGERERPRVSKGERESGREGAMFFDGPIVRNARTRAAQAPFKNHLKTIFLGG